MTFLILAYRCGTMEACRNLQRNAEGSHSTNLYIHIYISHTAYAHLWYTFDKDVKTHWSCTESTYHYCSSHWGHI